MLQPILSGKHDSSRLPCWPRATDFLFTEDGYPEKDHSGNAAFLRIVGKHRSKYSSTANALNRELLSRKIVEYLENDEAGHRFLQKDPVTTKYFEINKNVAMEMTRACLANQPGPSFPVKKGKAAAAVAAAAKRKAVEQQPRSLRSTRRRIEIAAREADQKKAEDKDDSDADVLMEPPM